MRHGKSGRKLGRTSTHRNAMLSNMTASVLTHEQIETTLPKAKEVRRVVDRMITLGKQGGLHARRQALAYLQDEGAVGKLFDVLATRYKERPGGYTRVMKAGFRHGDSAPMAVVELIERDPAAKGAADRARVEAAAAENPAD
jgi:large subunit ribosomal protein L17